MACPKTTPTNPENHTSQVATSQSPPSNVVNDQSSDHSPLNETPLRTVLQDIIIPASDTPKSSKPKISKQPTRRSQRMRKSSSSKPTSAHVDLVSDDEERNEASDKEVASEKGNVSKKTEEVHSEQGKEVAEEEANSQGTEETLLEMAKAARKVYKRRKNPSTTSSEKLSSPSLQNEEVEEEEAPARKRGKGKDIAILASALKLQNMDKMASRPLSRAKYFDF